MPLPLPLPLSFQIVHGAAIPLVEAGKACGIFDGKDGGRDKDRTCDPYDVNVVLYR